MYSTGGPSSLVQRSSTALMVGMGRRGGGVDGGYAMLRIYKTVEFNRADFTLFK